MWTPILPLLGEKFTVIAPGPAWQSGTRRSRERPGHEDCCDSAFMGSPARSEVQKSQGGRGTTSASWFAYALRRAVPRGSGENWFVMDAFSPRAWVEWGGGLQQPRASGIISCFNGPTPEALVQGRERRYFRALLEQFRRPQDALAIGSRSESYTAAYARPGRIRAGWAYFRFHSRKPRRILPKLSQTKLNHGRSWRSAARRPLGEVLRATDEIGGFGFKPWSCLKTTGPLGSSRKTPRRTTDAAREVFSDIHGLYVAGLMSSSADPTDVHSPSPTLLSLKGKG